MTLKVKLIGLLLFVFTYSYSQNSERPNILFVLCDDLNLLGLGTLSDSILHTPNLDSLIGQSVVFTNAHANSAGCGPSRASMFSGVLPQTSGHSGYKMSQNSWLDNPLLAQTTSVFKMFLDNEYDVYTSGKIYHSFRYREEDFTDYFDETKTGPLASNGRIHSSLPSSFQQFDLSFSPLENIPSYPEYTGWQNPNGSPFLFDNDENRDLMGDEMTVEYCKNYLESYAADSLDKPFFLSAGFYKPHQPFHVPQKYYDYYNPYEINLARLQPDSAIPSLTAVTNRYNANSNKAFDLMRAESPDDDPDFYFRQYVHGYYAAVSFIDDLVGQLMASLEENGLAENTIIVLTSDHGFHLGSKGLVEKSTLWNDATAVPLIIKDPSESPQIITEPVSLVDLYPTLIQFADIPTPDSHTLDGEPLQNIISGGGTGSAILMGVAGENLEVGELSLVEHNHHAYLHGNFKYIHYSSGEDELYRLSTDFRETKDFSESAQFQGVKNRMYKALRSRIGYIRPPNSTYECLYYGDFSQELNGWGPSDPNSSFRIEENDSIFDSTHLVLTANMSVPITNGNIAFRSPGQHLFMLDGYSDEDDQTASIRIRSDNFTYLDTTFTIHSGKTSFAASFEVTEPLPEFGNLNLLLRSNSSFDMHIDNVHVRNVEALQNSLMPCEESSMMQIDPILSQVIGRQLQGSKDQRLLSCNPLATNSVPQLWLTFSPEGTTGVLGATIADHDPVVEIFTDCDLDGEAFICIDEKTNIFEATYLTGLDPSLDYYVRITTKKDLPIYAQEGPIVRSLFINAKPAELITTDLDVLDQNGSLNLLDQVYFDYPISKMTFRFENVFSGGVFVVNANFRPSLSYPLSLFTDLEAGEMYRVSVRFKGNVGNVEIPYGPEKTFLYQPVASLTTGFTTFPNPLNKEHSTLNLQFDNIESGEGVVSIFDLTGRQVYSKSSQIQGHSLNIKGLPRLSQGTYVVSFQGVDNSSNQELLLVQ